MSDIATVEKQLNEITANIASFRREIEDFEAKALTERSKQKPDQWAVKKLEAEVLNRHYEILRAQRDREVSLRKLADLKKQQREKK